MQEISVTITSGKGSEPHNHDIKYRQELAHVDQDRGQVTELIAYKPYREQINEAMKPYIDEYNRKVEVRYVAAWKRYETGEIKTKPRRRDFQPEDPDYFAAHLHDTFFNRKTGKREK